MNDYIRTIRLTAPATEPVTLATAKTHLRVEHDEEDDLITALIPAARDKVEQYCNRFFASATAALLFDSLPAGSNPLTVPVPNVVSVDSVSYLDGDNATQVISGTTFNAEYQYLWPSDVWPSDTIQGARVAVTVGAPVSIDAITQAILLIITDLYEYRGDLTERQVYDNKAAVMLLQPYRVNMGV